MAAGIAIDSVENQPGLQAAVANGVSVKKERLKNKTEAAVAKVSGALSAPVGGAAVGSGTAANAAVSGSSSPVAAVAPGQPALLDAASGVGGEIAGGSLLLPRPREQQPTRRSRL